MIAPIAVSCGDPAGIGPEIAVAARTALGDAVPLLWLGDPRHLPAGTEITEVGDPADASSVPADRLPVLPIPFDAPATPGHPDRANAAGTVAAIRRGTELAQAGAVSALCTAPISKAVLIEGADFAFPGHTEFLADLTGAPNPVMMLASDALRVVPVTIHIPLSQVPAAFTAARLSAAVRVTAEALRRDFALPAPRLVVAGLNPHAGEQGRIGDEEVEWMGACVEALRDEGIDVRGPLSADTLFHARARAGYDAAICAYHDQALIPIKTLAFDEGVNVTLGLPIIRTSPDHGTAFDIAGTGRADPTSMIAALRMAQDMAQARAA